METLFINRGPLETWNFLIYDFGMICKKDMVSLLLISIVTQTSFFCPFKNVTRSAYKWMNAYQWITYDTGFPLFFVWSNEWMNECFLTIGWDLLSHKITIAVIYLMEHLTFRISAYVDRIEIWQYTYTGAYSGFYSGGGR